MTFTAHKEIYIKGEWHHIDTVRSPISISDWSIFHNNADTYRRRYSIPTIIDIDFIAPECPIHHLNLANLCSVRNLIGANKFDKWIGYWPWDDITVFMDEESRKDLIQEYVISNARLVCWVEK